MKKIMQINITCGKGSTGRLALALYQATIQEGNEARFAYSAYEPFLKEAFSIETKIQNYLRRGLNKYLGRKLKYSRPGTRRLIRYIEREKPDLIHLHNIQQNSVDYPIFFSYLKEKDIPIVFTLHDCWAFTGGCYHFAERGCSQYKDGCRECYPPIKGDDVIMTIAERYRIKAELIGKNDKIHPIAVSNWLCKCARESYMGKMNHVPEIIYNGVDITKFYPRDVESLRKQLAIMDEQIMILGVASFWQSGKGLDMFTELAEILGDKAKIVLVGGGLEKINADSNSKILTISRTDSREELARYYSAADIYVNASLEETFGMTTAEAMACGTPVVVFNSTANPELVDELSGIVVNDFEAEEVAEAVKEIRKRGKQFYSDTCVNRVRTFFSQERMLHNYLELYKQLLYGKEQGELNE